MNYFALAAALLAVLVALSYTIQVMRVALGKAYFNSAFARVMNFVMPPVAGVFAYWMFQIAVGA